MNSSSLFAPVFGGKSFSIDLLQNPFLWLVFFSLLLITLFLLYQYQQLEHKHQMALHALRTRISSDLHDDVGTLLSGLAMQAELMEVNPAEVDAAQLSRIAEMSRLAMSRMRDLVWTIDNRKDKWKHLIDRLYEHADDVLGPIGVDFILQLKDIDREASLSPTLRRNLYCIGKEAITNVAKHSNAGEVKIRIQKKNGKFDMYIQDNGKCPTEHPSRAAGLGLSNIRWRAQQLGAQLSIQHAKGFGILLQRIQVLG